MGGDVSHQSQGFGLILAPVLLMCAVGGSQATVARHVWSILARLSGYARRALHHAHRDVVSSSGWIYILERGDGAAPAA